MEWAVTNSKAKKVRWSQWHTVRSAPGLVEQPLEFQSPAGPGEGDTEKEKGGP